MKTEIIKENIEDAAEIIRRGGLVAVPTETVYGLAGNGLNEQAVRQIYEVKGRPEEKPINLLVRSMTDVEKVCVDIPAEAYKMAEAFWPGPLTMVSPKDDAIPDAVSCGLSTVGIRFPSNKIAQALINAAGVPVADSVPGKRLYPRPFNFQGT